MVEFTNLRTGKNWIYGDANDLTYNVRAKVKISKHQDKLFIDFENDFDNDGLNNIKKGCWVIQYRFEENNW